LVSTMRANCSSLQEVAQTLRGASRFVVAAHVRPDGDAVGSALGLALSLRAAGKQVEVLLEDGVPGNLDFLPQAATVLRPPYADLPVAEVAIALDTATRERLGAATEAELLKAPLLVNIDHHPTNPGYGHLNHIDAGQPAVGQIIHELLEIAQLPMPLEVLEHLYAAISTDTGSFQYPSTTARTHEIAARMLAAGLDAAGLAQRLYQSCPLRRVELLRAMLNEMRWRAEGRIVSWNLSLSCQQQIGMQAGDTEGLIDTLRQIDGVQAAVIFEELADGKVRVSARSKCDSLDVSVVCGRFGGGGHRLASGARLAGPLEQASLTFLEALEHDVRRLA
jgi:phosphoesterase RecJ-like protein